MGVKISIGVVQKIQKSTSGRAFNLHSKVNTIFINWFLNISSIHFFFDKMQISEDKHINHVNLKNISLEKSTTAGRGVTYGGTVKSFINSGVFSDW